jgi:hypothetical protein
MFIIKHDDETKARDLTVRMLRTAKDILNLYAEHNLAANLLPRVSLASENNRGTFNHGDKLEISIRQPRYSQKYISRFSKSANRPR